MGRGIVKLQDERGVDWFFEWSTVVDAPVTFRMTLRQLCEYIEHEYGQEGSRALKARLERVERTGTSFHDETAEVTVCVNRAGPGGTMISAEEICEQYAADPAE